MSIDDLNAALARHPRVTLGYASTPFEKLNALSQILGIELYIKRDDMTGLALGGNKVRQLEFYLGPAVEQGADSILITGALQSNFVRLAAAAARKLGMEPYLQLEERVPSKDAAYRNSGNIFIDRLLGANLSYFPEGENEKAADAKLDAMADELKAQGRKPYVIHLGMDSPPIGALGYVVCGGEVFEDQARAGLKVDAVVVPSGSGLTHSGFLAGCRLAGWDVPIKGICVRRDADLQQQRLMTRTAEVAQLLGVPDLISESDISVDDAVLAPGYGQMNDKVLGAIQMMAQREAILLDPVYTGRTFAGLIDLVERGEIEKGAQVVFLHTGGQAALFGYQDKLAPILSSSFE